MHKYINREVENLKCSQHENIVKVLGTISENGVTKCLVMELCHGSLKNLYDMRRTLPDHEVANITKQVFKGLKFLHGKGILHRYVNCTSIN